MAIPGIGFRTALDVLMEISYRIVEQVVLTSAPGSIATGSQTVPVGSTTAMYVGAQLVVAPYTTLAEVVTITAVNPGVSFTGVFANAHAAGAKVYGATFPNQQPTDPFYSQTQMLEWLSRANNEFLSLCPTAYQLTQQSLIFGQVYQSTPANCIEINRVAVSQYFCVIASLTRTGDEVVAVTTSPHGLQVGSTVFIQNATTGFGGVFEIDTIISPTSFSYPQIAADGTATGGAVLYFSRAYETTSAEITMTNRTWRNEFVPVPTAWGEDRSGLYKWFVNGKPSSNYPAELLCSIRDTDTLTFLDSFLVPDILVYLIGYKVLAYALSSDNEQSDPARAAYCQARFDRGVAAVNRLLVGLDLGLKAGAA